MFLCVLCETLCALCVEKNAVKRKKRCISKRDYSVARVSKKALPLRHNNKIMDTLLLSAEKNNTKRRGQKIKKPGFIIDIRYSREEVPDTALQRYIQ
jgi:hypothetical protein